MYAVQYNTATCTILFGRVKLSTGRRCWARLDPNFNPNLSASLSPIHTRIQTLHFEETLIKKENEFYPLTVTSVTNNNIYTGCSLWFIPASNCVNQVTCWKSRFHSSVRPEFDPKRPSPTDNSVALRLLTKGKVQWKNFYSNKIVTLSIQICVVLYYVVANRTLVHLFMLNAIVLLFCGSWCSNQRHRVFISFVIAKRKLDLFGQCNHSSISAEMCKRQNCVLVQMCKHHFISRLFQLSTVEPVAKFDLKPALAKQWDSVYFLLEEQVGANQKLLHSCNIFTLFKPVRVLRVLVSRFDRWRDWDVTKIIECKRTWLLLVTYACFNARPSQNQEQQ